MCGFNSVVLLCSYLVQVFIFSVGKSSDRQIILLVLSGTSFIDKIIFDFFLTIFLCVV